MSQTATIDPAELESEGHASELAGLLVEFEDVDSLYAACEKVRDAGFSKWDAHTPFPVHGLDRAMGIKPSKIPWIVLTGGTLGATGGLTLQWWTNAVDYALVISGKPLFSLPANIPVTFETTVLLSAFSAVFGLFGLCGLPRFYHAVFKSRRFLRASDDRFFISIEVDDPKFHRERTRAFAESLGGTHVEELEA